MSSRETLLISGSLSQGYRGQLCQNLFRSTTREPIYLPSSNFFHTSFLGVGENAEFGQRSPESNVPNCLSNNFENEFLIHICVQLILN